jgi:hypothetical protein
MRKSKHHVSITSGLSFSAVLILPYLHLLFAKKIMFFSNLLGNIVTMQLKINLYS